jgi:hypothetical protein
MGTYTPDILGIMTIIIPVNKGQKRKEIKRDGSSSIILSITGIRRESVTQRIFQKVSASQTSLGTLHVEHRRFEKKNCHLSHILCLFKILVYAAAK